MNMRDLRIPGVVWVALIVIVLAVLRHYVPEPLYLEIAVVVAFAVLKAMNIGTAEIEELLAIIARLQTQIDKERPRGAEAGTMSMAAPVPPRVQPPNKFVRWLVG